MPTTPTREETNMLCTTFSYLGPIARMCLQSIPVTDFPTYHKALKYYMGKIVQEINAFVRLPVGGFHTMDKTCYLRASRMITILDAIDGGSCYTTRITIPWIAYQMFSSAQKTSLQECFNVYKLFSDQEPLLSDAGWFFEAYVHNWLRHGGTFSMEKLPINNSNQLPLTLEICRSKSLNYFTSPKNLAEQVCVEGGHRITTSAIGKYFLPFSRNYDSVDALAFADSCTLVVFQITIARSHAIKSHGLKMLVQSLPTTITSISIVFVIPDKRRRGYSKSQNVPLPHQVEDQAKDLQINLFRLILTDEIMTSGAIHAPHRCVEDSGHSAVDDSSSRHDQDSKIEGDGGSVGDSTGIEMTGI
ncbi:hypothetical protein HOY82DRAFT_536289 [Tuber indicum]|nr:hypothetical protein HOY82DRAFT_536289 [Tuber indicum]